MDMLLKEPSVCDDLESKHVESLHTINENGASAICEDN